MSEPAGGAAGVPARFQAALAEHRAGRLAEAVMGYQAVLAQAPEHIDAQANLAAALRRLGRRDEALAILDGLIAFAPGRAASHYARANVLMDLERWDEALAGYERALAIDPSLAAAAHARAHVLNALDRPDEALAAYDQALALAPDDPDIRTNRGNAFYRRGDFPSALADHARVLALRPDEARNHFNHAQALEGLGRLEEALAGYDRAVDIDPGLELAFWERARCQLKLGRFAPGWQDYEHRWREARFVGLSSALVTEDLRARLDPTLTREALAGRRVLLVGEQGVGDVLMFASMIPELARDAAQVTVLVEPRLQRLFRHSFPQVTVIDPAAARPPPAADHVVAIGSLGRLYRQRREDFPGTAYLAPRPEIRAHWAARLGPANGRLRVGLSWRGGVETTGRASRSIPLADLAPILDAPGCEFVSLQYGDPRAEVEAVNAGRERPVRLFPKADMDDFEDLAGLVQALDVVVSVQTAAVHLSGALGQRVLAMAPQPAEWRYGAAGSAMPWYRSVELVRQATRGAWGPVIDEVARRLAMIR